MSAIRGVLVLISYLLAGMPLRFIGCSFISLCCRFSLTPGSAVTLGKLFTPVTERYNSVLA